MATQQTRALGRIAVAPAVIALFLWMIVPLAMTIWFSFLRYNLLDPNPACTLLDPAQLLDKANRCLAGTRNYYYFLTDPAFFKAIGNSLTLVGWVLVISVCGGTLLALLLDQAIYGRSVVRLMVIAPFFVMPTVSALVWKNMMMHPVSGFLAWITKSLGLGAIDWFAHYPMTAIVIMVSWQWLPFAALIILTALQSFDEEQKEAAQMDGTPPLAFFWYMILPHLGKSEKGMVNTEYKRYLARIPKTYAIVKLGYSADVYDIEPVLIQPAFIQCVEPSDDDIVRVLRVGEGGSQPDGEY